MSTQLDALTGGLGLIDCDQHCYETRDAFTRYLPSKYLDRAIVPVRNANGQDVILAGDRVATFNSEQGLGFEMAYRPGTLKEMLAQMASGSPEENYQPEPMRPEYLERDARLAVLDRHRVDKCIMYPAGMALSAEHYVKDTEVLYASLRAFNRWYHETWGFNYQDRIYATALLSLRDLESAVTEVEQILSDGAKFVLLPTGPAYGRSPGEPYFDPIWSRLAEAGVTIALHVMPYWYFDAISPAWGHEANPGAWHMSAWQWNNVYGERPVEDTLSALIFDNLFGRHPDLNVVVSEHGAEWVPHFVHHMDKSRGMGRNGPWKGGKLIERPSEIFRRHVRVAPYPEDDIPAIAHGLGQSDSLVMGSDFPHAEGLAEPAQFAELLASFDKDAQHAILRGNAERLFATAGS